MRKNAEKIEMNRKIRTQLILAFGVVLALELVASAIVFTMTIGVSHRLEKIKVLRLPAYVAAKELEFYQLKTRSDIRQVALLVSTGQMDAAKDYQSKVAGDWVEINPRIAALQIFSKGFVLQENRDRVANLAADLPVLQREQTEMAAAFLAAGQKRVAPLQLELFKKVEPHGLALREVAASLTKSQTELLDKDFDSQLSSQALVQWILVISTILSIVLGFAIAYLFSSAIVGALGPVVERLKAIAAGDLRGAKLPDAILRRGDELGELATASQTMTENLRRLLGGLSDGIGTMAAAATELSAVSRETATSTATMSDRANAVATAAEEASANTFSIVARMDESANNLTSVAGATEQMSVTVGDISSNTARARTISEQATRQAQTITEQMQKLGQAAQEIGNVTETITNISAQTNLLALNATIEAARAGSAGKGFAVVANEIKELAKQTAEATEDIKARIAGIQNSTGMAISDIEQITGVIRDVGGIVASIAAAIEEQATVTRDVAGNIAMASEGVKEANRNVSETVNVSASIAQDIANVNASVREIRQGGEHVQASSDDLSKLAESLGAQVAQFRI
jgi:methyl-accepting chemotaxis protein